MCEVCPDFTAAALSTQFKVAGCHFRECVSKGAPGGQTSRSLGQHLLHPLILRLLVQCAPAVLRPRALQDAPAPADPNS